MASLASAPVPQSLQAVLNSNFTAVSTPCLQILSKYGRIGERFSEIGLAPESRGDIAIHVLLRILFVVEKCFLR